MKIKFKEGQKVKMRVVAESKKRGTKVIKGEVIQCTNYFVSVKTKLGYIESILYNDFEIGRAALI